MKGIFKKLFLGLFFFALVGAGLSKDVKAATVSPKTLVITANESVVEITAEFDSAITTSDEFGLLVDLGPGSTVEDITVSYSSGWIATGYGVVADAELKKFTLTSTSDQQETIRANAGSSTDLPLDGRNTNVAISVADKNMSTVKGEKTIAFVAPKVDVDWNIKNVPTEARLSDDEKNVNNYLVPSLTSEHYWMFKDSPETYSVVLGEKTGAPKKYLNDPNKYNLGFSTNNSGSVPGKTATGIRVGDTVTYTYTYDIIKSITPEAAFSKALATGCTSIPRTYIIESACGTTKWTTDDVDEKESISDRTYRKDGGKFTLSFQSSGDKTVPIKVKDGYALGHNFECNYLVSVQNPIKSLRFVNAGDGTIKKNSSNTETITSDDGPLIRAGFKQEPSSTNAANVSGSMIGVDTVKITSPSSATVGGKATITVNYDNAEVLEGTDLPTVTPATKTYTVTSPSKISVGSIGVSVGQSVNLSDFMLSGDGEILNYIADNSYAQLLNGKSKVAKLDGLTPKEVNIYGKKETGSKGTGWVELFSPEDTETYADIGIVTVYPNTYIDLAIGGGDSSNRIGLGSTGSSSSSSAGINISVPESTYHGSKSNWIEEVEGVYVVFRSRNNPGKVLDDVLKVSSSSSSSSSSGSSSSNSKTVSISQAAITNAIGRVADGDSDIILISAYPTDSSNYTEVRYGDAMVDTVMCDENEPLYVYKINLDGDRATYKVNGESITGSFYAIGGVNYKIESAAKNSGDKFEKWEGGESSTATIDKITFSSPRTLKAVYTSSSTSSSSSSSSSSSTGRTTAGGGSSSSSSGEGLDDVPKTGESKADIWILWTVLLVSILGAGFMIYRRFGVVNAIAKADAEEAQAIANEIAEEKDKERENNLRILRDLRDLK